MKSVKQMVQEYEDDIIPPPPEFRDENKMVVIVKNVKYQTYPAYDLHAASKGESFANLRIIVSRFLKTSL